MSFVADCCDKPNLRSLMVIGHAPDEEIVLRQCTHCLTFWRVTSTAKMRIDGLCHTFSSRFESLAPATAQDLLAGKNW